MKEIANKAAELGKVTKSDVASTIEKILMGEEIDLMGKAILYKYFINNVKEYKNPMFDLLKDKGNPFPYLCVGNGKMYTSNGHVLFYCDTELQDGFYDMALNQIDPQVGRFNSDTAEFIIRKTEIDKAFKVFYNDIYVSDTKENAVTFKNESGDDLKLDTGRGMGMKLKYYHFIGKPKECLFIDGKFIGERGNIKYIVMGCFL